MTFTPPDSSPPKPPQVSTPAPSARRRMTVEELRAAVANLGEEAMQGAIRGHVLEPSAMRRTRDSIAAWKNQLHDALTELANYRRLEVEAENRTGEMFDPDSLLP